MVKSSTNEDKKVKKSRTLIKKKKTFTLTVEDNNSKESSVLDYPMAENSVTKLVSAIDNPETNNKKSKLEYLVEEIVETEQTYISKLKLLYEGYFSSVKSDLEIQKTVPEKDIHDIFSNLASIYSLHNDFIMPEVIKCSKSPIKELSFGAFFKSMAPFLKMYSEFLTTFDTSMRLISEYRKKNSHFSNVLQKIKDSSDNPGLSIEDHMLELAQRVPRYQLLLQSYFDALPPSHKDIGATNEAMTLIINAVTQTDKNMSIVKQFEDAIMTKSQILGASQAFYDTTTDFIYESEINRLKKGGSKKIAHIFLTSYYFLICSRNSNGTFKVTDEVLNDNVLNFGEFPEEPFAVFVQETNKEIYLGCSSPESNTELIEKLCQAFGKGKQQSEGKDECFLTYSSFLTETKEDVLKWGFVSVKSEKPDTWVDVIAVSTVNYIYLLECEKRKSKTDLKYLVKNNDVIMVASLRKNKNVGDPKTCQIEIVGEIMKITMKFENPAIFEGWKKFLNC